MLFLNSRLLPFHLVSPLPIIDICVAISRAIFMFCSTIKREIFTFNIIKSDKKEWNIDRVLESFPQLKTKLQNNSASLSGGEQQMLAIGKALLTNPKLILLDEPTQGLAPNIVIELIEILKIIFEGAPNTVKKSKLVQKVYLGL